MIGVIARLKARDGMEDKLGSTFQKLADEVSSSEPDTISYHALQSKSDPTEFVVVEIYRSEAAFDAHMKAAHTIAALTEAKPCFAQPPQIERLKSIG